MLFIAEEVNEKRREPHEKRHRSVKHEKRIIVRARDRPKALDQQQHGNDHSPADVLFEFLQTAGNVPDKDSRKIAGCNNDPRYLPALCDDDGRRDINRENQEQVANHVPCGF